MKIKAVLLDLLGVISFWGPYPDVDGADIDHNIQLLKKNQWFQILMKDEKSRKLIIHDQDVRYEIGYLNTERLKKNFHIEVNLMNKVLAILILGMGLTSAMLLNSIPPLFKPSAGNGMEVGFEYCI